MTVFAAFSNDEILADLKANVTAGSVITDPATLKKQSFSPNLTDDDSGLALASSRRTAPPTYKAC